MANISTISITSSTDSANPFEVINEKVTITLSEDAKNPLDATDYIIPQGTVLAPILDGTEEGLYKPVRRALVTDVTSSTVTVSDASPFENGQIVQYIDSTGPESGGVVNAGTISGIDYDANTFDVSSVGSLAAGDWVEVTENGTGNDTGNIYNMAQRGVLIEDVDVRIDAATDSTTKPTIAAMVVDGAIHEDNLNIVDSLADDPIVIYELSTHNLAGDVYVRTDNAANDSYSQEDID